MTHRTLMQSGVAGLAFAYGLAGCGDGEKSGGAVGGSEQSSGTVTSGSNYSDPIPRKALQEVFDAFETSSGVTVDVNTVDQNRSRSRSTSSTYGEDRRRLLRRFQAGLFV